MKNIKTWASAHKAATVAVAIVTAGVLCVAGSGAALALSGGLDGWDDIVSEEGQDDGPVVSDDSVILDEVPEGAEIVEDADAPEGTVAVKDASGNVSYVPAAKAEAAVSNGTASRPAASTGSTSGGSSAATPAPAPEAPKHVCSASVPKTVVDQAAWTEYIPGTTNICVNCGGLDCGHNATSCPNCGTTSLCHVRYNKDVIEHPAVTHTEWYCTCGAKM